MEGAIVDESTDPIFDLGTTDPLTGNLDPAAFGGELAFTTSLVNPIVEASEPATAGLFAVGLAGLGLVRARKRAA